MSNAFDIAGERAYRGGMFSTRMRRLFSSMSRHVDVMPDTLVLRAWEGLEPSSRPRATV